LNGLNSASDAIHFYSVDLVMLMGAWDTLYICIPFSADFHIVPSISLLICDISRDRHANVRSADTQFMNDVSSQVVSLCHDGIAVQLFFVPIS
jgi:hypothetical protein